MRQFKLNGKYYGRFFTAYDKTVTVQVVKRTAKTVVVQQDNGPGRDMGDQKRKKIRQGSDCEFINYCAGVIISADKEAV